MDPRLSGLQSFALVEFGCNSLPWSHVRDWRRRSGDQKVRQGEGSFFETEKDFCPTCGCGHGGGAQCGYGAGLGHKAPGLLEIQRPGGLKFFCFTVILFGGQSLQTPVS